MPLKQSRHLVAIGSRLRAIHVPAGHELGWKCYTEFCSLHDAESTVIPRGVRDGFPESIDFLGLERRVSRAWIGTELHAVAMCPYQSPLFNETVKMVSRAGKSRWNSIGYQSSEVIVNSTMPG